MAVTDGEGRLRPYFVVRLRVLGRNVMVGITTIILIMLVAALVVAGVVYAEWGH